MQFRVNPGPFPRRRRPAPCKNQNNELRNINTVLTTDLVRASTMGRQDRDTAVSDAETTLGDHAAAGSRHPSESRGHLSLRHAAGSIVGALRLDNRQNGRGLPGGSARQQQEGTVALRKAKEMGQWAVLEPPAESAVAFEGDPKEVSTNEVCNQGVSVFLFIRIHTRMCSCSGRGKR